MFISEQIKQRCPQGRQQDSGLGHENILAQDMLEPPPDNIINLALSTGPLVLATNGLDMAAGFMNLCNLFSVV